MVAGFDWISFTTDYGLSDGFVAACHGRIASLVPRVRVIDVTHLIPPQDLRQGASVLAKTIGSLPPAVHLAVVDPGVGTRRRPVAVSTPGGVLVGPDNGILPDAADLLGGIEQATELTNADYWAPRVSSTFHGRDIFAPVAAHVACGVPVERMGVAFDPVELVRLPDPVAAVERGRLRAEAILVDHFGSVALAATAADLAECDLVPGTAVTIETADAHATATVATTFADVPVGELVVFVDSDDHVGIACNRGSTVEVLGCGVGDEIIVASRG